MAPRGVRQCIDWLRVHAAAQLFYLFYWMANVCLQPYLAVLWRELSFSGSQIGLLAFIRPLVAAPSGQLLMMVADAYQIHFLILVAAFVSTVACRSAMSITTAFGMHALLVLISEGANSPLTILADASVAASTDDAGYGRRRLFGSIGWGGLAPLTGWIMGHYGIRANIHCYTVMALLAAVPTLLLPLESLSLRAWVGGHGDKAGEPHVLEAQLCNEMEAGDGIKGGVVSQDDGIFGDAQTPCAQSVKRCHLQGIPPAKRKSEDWTIPDGAAAPASHPPPNPRRPASLGNPWTAAAPPCPVCATPPALPPIKCRHSPMPCMLCGSLHPALPPGAPVDVSGAAHCPNRAGSDALAPTGFPTASLLKGQDGSTAQAACQSKQLSPYTVPEECAPSCSTSQAAGEPHPAAAGDAQEESASASAGKQPPSQPTTPAGASPGHIRRSNSGVALARTLSTLSVRTVRRVRSYLDLILAAGDVAALGIPATPHCTPHIAWETLPKQGAGSRAASLAGRSPGTAASRGAITSSAAARFAALLDAEYDLVEPLLPAGASPHSVQSMGGLGASSASTSPLCTSPAGSGRHWGTFGSSPDASSRWGALGSAAGNKSWDALDSISEDPNPKSLLTQELDPRQPLLLPRPQPGSVAAAGGVPTPASAAAATVDDGSVWSGVREQLRDPKVVAFYVTAFIMGIANGCINYLMLYLKGLGASGLLLGLCCTMNCCGDIPALYFSGWWLAKLGVERAMQLALVGYVIRLGAYTLLPLAGSLWWVLGVEIVQGLTFGFSFCSATVNCKRIAKPHLRSTTQAIFTGLYLGIGPAISGLVGGYIYQAYGLRSVFAIGLVVLLIGWACISIALHLALRRAASARQNNGQASFCAAEWPYKGSENDLAIK